MVRDRIRLFKKDVTSRLLRRFASCSRGLFAIIGHVGRHSGQRLRRGSNSFAQRVLTFFGTYLRVQIARGTLRANLNPDIALHALIGSVVTLVGRRQFLHDQEVTGYTHEEIAQAVVATLLQGIQTGSFFYRRLN